MLSRSAEHAAFVYRQAYNETYMVNEVSNVKRIINQYSSNIELFFPRNNFVSP